MAWNPEEVVSSPGSTDQNLLKTLAPSDELEQAIYALLDPQTYELASNEPNFLACFDLHIDGYPPEILDRLLRYSNAMQTMAGMPMANLTGNPTLQQAMGKSKNPLKLVFLTCCGPPRSGQAPLRLRHERCNHFFGLAPPTGELGAFHLDN